MTNPRTQLDPAKFRGSMKVGRFSAQLFVDLTVTPDALTLNASWRSFRIDRQNFQGIEDRKILGLFKYGFRFRHRQPDLAPKVIFVPSMNHDAFRQKLGELGWC